MSKCKCIIIMYIGSYSLSTYPPLTLHYISTVIYPSSNGMLNGLP